MKMIVNVALVAASVALLSGAVQAKPKIVNGVGLCQDKRCGFALDFAETPAFAVKCAGGKKQNMKIESIKVEKGKKKIEVQKQGLKQYTKYPKPTKNPPKQSAQKIKRKKLFNTAQVTPVKNKKGELFDGEAKLIVRCLDATGWRSGDDKPLQNKPKSKPQS